ncbi:uncharacterized protein LOC105685690 [Athalia rosae]|uniref:uncharacterized protein LOC105685690 n=1 Tax=Athalia rosae TaxID=37344 RepID=UPI00203363D4|nr:uncharacterized protein LOC105685690 [Athalia rosae]XP_048505468.1 uncharacterized protein LOC105685690 [Athalia rosae]XP_048505469.1 uncharacterized protein LOC105685690 [Athalia rosae]XP_048505470.1 uncharacterized protein LOC105685690 [Athalia rosae]
MISLRSVIGVITHRRKTSLPLNRDKKISPFTKHSKQLVSYAILLFCVFNILSVDGFEQSNISYVDECRTDCARLRDPFACGKYRAVQWIHNLTSEKDIRYGSFRLIKLSSSPVDDPVLPEVPKFRGFGRYSKFLNFVRSSAEEMLTRRAIVYTIEQRQSARSLSSGPMIMDTDELNDFVETGRSGDDRLFKKKKKGLAVILPILILLKLLKMKLLLLPIFLGVHFIKKILLIGALAIPSILANLKYCKIPPMHHHQTAYSTWATAADTPVDYSLGSGHEDEGWSQKIDMLGYGGAGAHDPLVASASRNPYRGYYAALKQQQLQNVM